MESTFWWYAINKKIKRSEGLCFLLSVIDVYSKYAWVIALKNKIKCKNEFQKIRLATQTNIGLRKIVCFTTDQWNHGYKIMIMKFFIHMMKVN